MERFPDIIELQDLLRQALELNAALVAENAALRERIADLEARLKKDSSNSGKPPSSDGFRKPAPKSQRQKSGRKPGGQSGHKGSGLAMRAEPNETVDIPAPTSCHACGCDLSAAVLAGAVEARQVIGFKIIPWVTEYRSASKRCPDCGVVAKAPVACFDETSLRAENANHWVHVATTPSVVFYHFDAKRGREAMDRAGVLPNFSGVAIHDRLKSYEAYSCKHAYCWDHLKRDLTYLAEQRGWKWAKETLGLFKKMYCACRKPIEKRNRHGYKSRYGRLLAKAELENEIPLSGTYRSERKKESRRLQNALKAKRNDILLPLDNPSIPPTNNLAKRSLRMLKVKQKISDCFRNARYGSAFAIIASYVETARRNGVTPLKAIADAIAGTPNIPGVLS